MFTRVRSGFFDYHADTETITRSRRFVFHHEVSRLQPWATQRLVRLCHTICHMLLLSMYYCRNRLLWVARLTVCFPLYGRSWCCRYKRSEQNYSALIGKTTSHERSLNHPHREDRAIQCPTELQRTKKPVIHEWNCRQVRRVHVATLSLRWSHCHKNRPLVALDCKRGFTSDCRGNHVEHVLWNYSLCHSAPIISLPRSLASYLFPFSEPVRIACIVLYFPLFFIPRLWWH